MAVSGAESGAGAAAGQGKARGSVREWLEGRRRAWGQLRYAIYVGLLLFSTAFVLFGLLMTKLMIPAEGVFSYLGHDYSGREIQRQVFLPYWGIVMIMTALIYLYLLRILILPMEQLRRRLGRSQRRSSGRPQGPTAEAKAGQEPAYRPEDIEVLEVSVQAARQQVDDMQTLLTHRSDLLEKREAQLKLSDKRHAAYVETLAEAAIETDADAVIVSATSMAAQLLGTSAATLIGKRVTDVLAVYDGDKQPWRDHSLAPQIAGVLTAGASTPCLFRGVMADRNGSAQPVSVTVLPFDTAARPLGGTIRLFAEGQMPALLEGTGVANALLDTDSGLPNHQAFRSRVSKLIEGAREHTMTHTVGLFVVGGVRDEDDPAETFRHNLAAMLGQTLRRSMDGTAELYRIGGVAYGLIKTAARPDSMRDLAETVRALCQLDVARLDEERGHLTVRYALTDLSGASDNPNAVEAELVALLTNQSTLRAATGSVSDREKDLLVERARWVAERMLDNRLRLTSQSVLTTDPAIVRKPWLEVFVRLEDDDGHWLEPAHFLKAVEHVGEVDRLDSAVFQRIVAACRDEPTLLDRYEGISLNVSTQSLASEQFLNQLIESTRALGVEPARFAIEIDQRLLSAPPAAMSGVELLLAAGVRIIVDGCNDIRGLRLMRQVRPFMIKLSSDLLDASKLDPVIDAELQAIVSSAKVLGVRLSAKNVANGADLRRLSALGIQYAQGVGVESIGPIVG